MQRVHLDPGDAERAQKIRGSEGEEKLLPENRHFDTSRLIPFKVLSSQASLRSVSHRRGSGQRGRVQRGILHSTTALVAEHQESQKEEHTVRC